MEVLLAIHNKSMDTYVKYENFPLLLVIKYFL